MMSFKIKRLVIDSHNEEGNGIQEDALSFNKQPVDLVIEEGENFSNKLRMLVIKLISTRQYLPPESAKFVHIKTNAIKGINIAAVLKV